MSIYRYREYMASNSAYEDYSVVANSYDKYRVAFGIEIILGALGKYSERNPLSSLSILEAGCGTGNFTLEMCRYVAHVTAVDGSDDMLAVAESKLKGAKNVSFKNVDLRKELSFESNQFDGVLLINVAHHLDELAPDGQMKTEKLKSLISEFHRVLKEGAPLIIVTATEEQMMKCTWHYYFAMEKGFQDIIQQHTRRYISLELLGNICGEIGFKNEKRLISTSEKFYTPDYYRKENVFSKEYRLADSSWRDFEKSEIFSHLLSAIRDAIEKNELDGYIDQSESLSRKLGYCTFLVYNKK